MAHNWPDPQKFCKETFKLDVINDMVYFSFACLLKLILYNSKPQNQMCDWKPKMFLFCFTKLWIKLFYMTQTFDSEFSLHSWLLWPMVCRLHYHNHLPTFSCQRSQRTTSRLALCASPNVSGWGSVSRWVEIDKGQVVFDEIFSTLRAPPDI